MNSTCCNRHEVPPTRRELLAKAGLGLGGTEIAAADNAEHTIADFPFANFFAD